MPNIHIMAIMILGQLFGGGNFPLFYQGVVCSYMRKHFRNLVSYSWFIRLRQKVFIDLFFSLKYKSITKGDCFFIDSTPIKVCHNRRIKRHKTFKELASRGHHSMGWFFGFKLHIITEKKERGLENWEQLSTFWSYPDEIRRLIYTTNPIESFNRCLRKMTKNRPSFPDEDALVKSLFLGIQRLQRKWTTKISNWGITYSQLQILFNERLNIRS